MNYLDLFSGIGGFALGAYWAGWRFDRHYFSEVDPWAVELYQKRFPDAIPLGDIRAIKGEELPSGEWVITAGFPCQDISYAGPGGGLAGARSGLFYEAARIIGELGPRIVILENVRALLTRGIGAVLGTLSDLGLNGEWEVIRASDVGAPHKRERVWIVAYPTVLGRGEIGTRELAASGEDASNTSGRIRSGVIGRTQSPVGFEGCREAPHPHREPTQWVTEPWCECGRGPTQPRLGRRPDGLSTWLDGWEQGIPRLATGVPNRVNRLRGDGNAIVPQIAQLIFEAIGEAA